MWYTNSQQAYARINAGMKGVLKFVVEYVLCIHKCSLYFSKTEFMFCTIQNKQHVIARPHGSLLTLREDVSYVEH